MYCYILANNVANIIGVLACFDSFEAIKLE